MARLGVFPRGPPGQGSPSPEETQVPWTRDTGHRRSDTGRDTEYIWTHIHTYGYTQQKIQTYCKIITNVSRTIRNKYKQYSTITDYIPILQHAQQKEGGVSFLYCRRLPPLISCTCCIFGVYFVNTQCFV